MTTPRATVYSLATETLQEVFSYFCLHCCGQHQSTLPHEHRRGTRQNPSATSWQSLECHTLFSTCLVSKHFCAIAQPILYHEFVPGYGDSWRSNLYSWDDRLVHFVRTVAQRRDLAARVGRAYIHPYLLESVDLQKGKDAIREAADALQIEDRRGLISEDLTALLFALLPNLQHCSLQLNESRVQIVYASALRKARISSLPLRTLDVVLHAHPHRCNLLNFGYCASVLLEVATHLQTLNLHMCDGIWTKPPFPSLPNLKTIRITHSRISAEDLEGLLLSCNGLRSFTYESCGPYIPRVWWAAGPSGNHLKPLDAVRLLRRRRETLKSLHLDWRRREASPTASGDVYFDRPEPVIDFRDFTGLQHLFLNASEFYDSTYQEPPPLTQLLPHSITSLQFAADLRCSVPRLSNGMLGLAGAISEGHFPNLREVTCDAENRLDNEPLVSALFAAAGVEFGYDSWPMSEATLNLPSDMPPIPDFYECYLREETSQLPLPDEEDPDLM